MWKTWSPPEQCRTLPDSAAHYRIWQYVFECKKAGYGYEDIAAKLRIKNPEMIARIKQRILQ
jgi:hypothetical protein